MNYQQSASNDVCYMSGRNADGKDLQKLV